MKNAVHLLTLLAIFATLKLGECNLKCYICDSKANPNCVQPDKHKMETRECLPNNLADMRTAVEEAGLTKISNLFEIEIDRSDYTAPLSCMKAVTKVLDKEIIIRGCQLTPKDNLDVCKKLLEDGKDIVQYCSFCNENGCNSAPIETMSVALIGLVLPALVFL